MHGLIEYIVHVKYIVYVKSIHIYSICEIHPHFYVRFIHFHCCIASHSLTIPYIQLSAQRQLSSLSFEAMTKSVVINIFVFGAHKDAFLLCTYLGVESLHPKICIYPQSDIFKAWSDCSILLLTSFMASPCLENQAETFYLKPHKPCILWHPLPLPPHLEHCADYFPAILTSYSILRACLGAHPLEMPLFPTGWVLPILYISGQREFSQKGLS